MKTHWNEELFSKEELKSLKDERNSEAPVTRLAARIERRHGRPRQRRPDYAVSRRRMNPTLPEAA